MSSNNQQTLRKFIEAVWNQGDLAAIPQFLGSEYRIHHDPGDPWEGQTLTVQGFQERVRISREPIPDQRFEIQQIYSDTTTVCITWSWRGTHLGEISGFSATGRTLRCLVRPSISLIEPARSLATGRLPTGWVSTSSLLPILDNAVVELPIQTELNRRTPETPGNRWIS